MWTRATDNEIRRPENSRSVLQTIDTREIVLCKDCMHYYEAENYHPSGTYVTRWCKYFDTYNDEVAPNGFCAWGERKIK